MFFIPNIPEKLRFRFVGWIVISFLEGLRKYFFLVGFIGFLKGYCGYCWKHDQTDI